MTAIWDEAFLKQRERDAREEALAAQSDDDWELAVLQLERAQSNLEYGFADCRLPACRRAKCCVGNPPLCTARSELEPGAEQDLVEEFYADIQQERRDAAAQGRAPEVERALDYVQEDDEAIDEIDEPPPPRDEPERDMRMVREALQRDDAPSQPPPQPQPQLPKPEPAAAPPPVALAADARPAAPAVPAAPPPDPWAPAISPEVEERINRIWADYVAGRPMPRPVPRIRSL